MPLETLSALLAQQVEPASIAAACWPAIVECAQAHHLAPMLYWAVRQAKASVPAVDLGGALWQPVKHAALQAAARYDMLEDVLRQVNTALGRAGIPAVWLKGGILANTVYPRPWTRPMVDLDVLVPCHLRQPALQALQGCGFQTVDEAGRLWSRANFQGLDNDHHVILEGGPGRAVALELHYWLLSGPHLWMTEPTMAWFHEQTREMDIPAGRVRALKPEAHLLYLAAHAQLQHGEQETTHLHAMDVYLAVTREALDWDLLVDQAVAFGWTCAAERSLRRVRQYFGGPALDTALPEAVLQALHDRRPAHEDPARIDRLGHKGARWERGLRSMQRLSPGDTLRMFLHIAAPPPAYVRSYYGIAPHRSLVPGYMQGWADLAAEFGHWLARRRNDRRSTSKEKP